MRTATETSWILKTGSCYIHEGGAASEKFIIRVTKLFREGLKKWWRATVEKKKKNM